MLKSLGFAHNFPSVTHLSSSSGSANRSTPANLCTGRKHTEGSNVLHQEVVAAWRE